MMWEFLKQLLVIWKRDAEQGSWAAADALGTALVCYMIVVARVRHRCTHGQIRSFGFERQVRGQDPRAYAWRDRVNTSRSYVSPRLRRRSMATRCTTGTQAPLAVGWPRGV